MALPSSDDFRTSLLMPNLSARFSMLREQDDPNSKLGKANDDSVLFPKRVSRLNLFNPGGLSDIAEVASIRSSIRPPFASFDRKDSFGSGEGYGTDDDSSHGGSVMSRARPGEGNNLFGGRQKVYKIPTGTSSKKDVSSPGDGGMGGRQLYDDDVNLSAFQKMKQKERDERREREMNGFVFDDEETHAAGEEKDAEGEKDVERRQTSSSTNSGPSNKRSSTAATSVASSGGPKMNGSSVASNASHTGLDRSGTKGRRMYGHGLDQHMIDQQSSAMNRLNSIQRQRAFTQSPTLAQSRSATNLHDRYHQATPLYASSSFHTTSPPPSAVPSGLSSFDLTPDEKHDSPISPTAGYGFLRPLSPPVSDGESTPLAAAVQPEDVGKATATGLFQKPSAQYNEDKFSQRQVQMQKARDDPETRQTPSPQQKQPTQVDSDSQRSRNQSDASLYSNQESISVSRPGSSSNSRKPFEPIHERQPSQPSSVSEDARSEGKGTFLANFSSDGESDQEDEILPPPLRLPEEREVQRQPSDAIRQPVPFGQHVPEEREIQDFKVESAIERPGSRQAANKPPSPESPAIRERGFSREQIQERRQKFQQRAPNRNFFKRSPSRQDEHDESSSPSNTTPRAPSRQRSDDHARFRNMSPNVESEPPQVPERSRSRPREPSVSRTTTLPYLDIEEDDSSEAVNGIRTTTFDLPRPPKSPVTSLEADSPTLGPGIGLSGLIRTHLRSESGQSSIYPPPSPGLSSKLLQEEPKPQTSFNAYAESSNPWEAIDVAGDALPEAPQPQPAEDPEPPQSMSSRAKQILGQAMALKEQQDSENRGRVPEKQGPPAVDSQAPVTNWSDILRNKHQRGGSTETQREREDFANELAERRKKVQENLRSFVEAESRSSSPVPGQRSHESTTGKAGAAFGMLKSKSSKGVISPKQETSSKAMKMLGLGGPPTSGSGTASPQQHDLWREEEEQMLRDLGRGQRFKPRSPNIGGPPPTQYRMPGVRRRESREEVRDLPSSGRQTPSQQSIRSGRPSPESHVPRSMSRNGQFEDERSRPMYGDRDNGSGYSPPESMRSRTPSNAPRPSMETSDRVGRSRQASNAPRPSVDTFRSVGPRPSVDTGENYTPGERSASAMSGRFRSNSRSTATGYFDSKLAPIQTNSPNLIGLSPRPSPIAPYSANSTPPLTETSPAVSAATTPTLGATQAFPNGSSRNIGPRKKSIYKSQISEPVFISSTSNMPTVGLPPGASLSNGAESVTSPPVPPMNPRRRRPTATQTILGLGRSDKNEELAPPMSAPFREEVRSTFSDEGDSRPAKPRKLRKSSSEGGNLNARARHQALMAPSPALPTFPHSASHLPSQVAAEGGMF